MHIKLRRTEMEAMNSLIKKLKYDSSNPRDVCAKVRLEKHLDSIPRDSRGNIRVGPFSDGFISLYDTIARYMLKKGYKAWVAKHAGLSPSYLLIGGIITGSIIFYSHYCK